LDHAQVLLGSNQKQWGLSTLEGKDIPLPMLRRPKCPPAQVEPAMQELGLFLGDNTVFYVCNPLKLVSPGYL